VLNAGVTDVDGNLVVGGDQSVTWVMERLPSVSLQQFTRSSASGVPYVEMTFSEPVEMLDRSDFELSRDGELLDLSQTSIEATIDPLTYRLVGLTPLTNPEGLYELRLAPGAIVIDSSSFLVLPGSTSTTTFGVSRPPTVTIEEIGVSAVPVDQLTIHFSEPVSGFDVSSLELRHNGELLSTPGMIVEGGPQDYAVLGINTFANGIYTVTLDPRLNAIRDATANALLIGTSVTFEVAVPDTPPVSTSPPVPTSPESTSPPTDPPESSVPESSVPESTSAPASTDPPESSVPSSTAPPATDPPSTVPPTVQPSTVPPAPTATSSTLPLVWPVPPTNPRSARPIPRSSAPLATSVPQTTAPARPASPPATARVSTPANPTRSARPVARSIAPVSAPSRPPTATASRSMAIDVSTTSSSTTPTGTGSSRHSTSTSPSTSTSSGNRTNQAALIDGRQASGSGPGGEWTALMGATLAALLGGWYAFQRNRRPVVRPLQGE
jgi:hypothetical protein